MEENVRVKKDELESNENEFSRNETKLFQINKT